MKKIFNRKTGSNAFFALTVALALVIVLLINILVTVAGNRYPLEADLTKNRVFALSGDSIDFVRTLDKPVTLYVLAQESVFADTSTYNAQANNILRQFDKYGNNIDLVYVDYVRNPGFAAGYPTLSMKQGDILVTSGTKTHLVKTEGLFVYTGDAKGNPVIASSRAEEAIDAAILSVISDVSPIAVFLEGHGEYGMPAFRSLLENNNFTLADANTATGDLPSDASLIVLVAPMNDFSEQELERIDRFLMNDGLYGRTLLYCADAAEQPNLPNLETFLREWGVAVGSGAVFETEENRVYNYNPFYPIADFSETDFSGMLRSQDAPMLMPISKPLEALFEYRGNNETKIMLEFAASTGVRPADAPEGFSADDAVQKGPMPALILAKRNLIDRSTGQASASSQILVSGSAGMLDEFAVSSPSFANAEYLSLILGQLCGQDTQIRVTPKSITGSALNLSRGQADVLGVVFIAGLPICLLLVAAFVWLRRRNS